MNSRTRTLRSLSLSFLGLLALMVGGHACSSSPTSSSSGPCKTSADCDQGSGFECIEGACLVRCDSHFDCASIGLCQPLAGATYCVESTPATKGQYYGRCPQGPGDCDAANGFVCLGSGPGDLDAFCTTDCGGDQDCPDGFRCSVVGATPCGSACGEMGQDVPGCAPAEEIGVGKRYECQGVLGLVRHACLLRDFCSSCETDEDCLAVPNQLCAKDKSGAKICTQRCDPGVDSCPWGAAAECGKWDTERDVYTCGHRFGACQGAGLGCEPCVDASDCPKGYCSRSSFTGERFCVDLSVPCDCGSDADANDMCSGHGCPDSPGGLTMTCYSGARFEGDPLSQRCVSASSTETVSSSPRTGCWAK